ncbi:cytochrome b reductase 1-like [Anneissia japonica]|uniref:cytochrome b reductase 1-like n=1 Tax=Anneissia japonica TaxID=1529436 RepID=UPI001425AF2B|nr:cytochrome b reductase 1-like [Anneissia japonica]
MARGIVLAIGCVAEFLGLCAIITIVVVGNKIGGFAAFPSFNYHPLLMTLGFVFIFGHGILTFQIISNLKLHVSRLVEKLIHFGTLSMGCVFMFIGWSCADSMDGTTLFPHGLDYEGSPHSCIGLAAIIFFGLQGLVGFTFFLFPKFGSALLRLKVVKIHRLFGLFSFLMAVVATLMGATELAMLQSLQSASESTPSITPLVVVFVSCILMFAFSVISIQIQPVMTAEDKDYSQTRTVQEEMSEMVHDLNNTTSE